MIFFNDIINAGGTPSIQENILANRPIASTAGRLFIQTDSPYNFFRDTGSTWQQISGSGGSGVSQIIAGSNVTISPIGGTGAVTINASGGGGSQDLNNVLSLGGSLSADRSSNLNNYGWELQNIDYFNINTFSQNNWLFTTTSLKFYGNVIDYVNNLFSINYTNGECAFGDFGGQFNGTHMNVNVPGHNIYFAPEGFSQLWLNSHDATLGDYNNQYNATTFVVDDEGYQIYSNLQGAPWGIYIERWRVSIGDVYGTTNGVNLYIDDQFQEIYTAFGNNNGLKITNEQTIIGDFENYGNSSMFILNDGDGVIYSTLGGFGTGILLDAGHQILGDWEGNFNGMKFIIENYPQKIYTTAHNLNYGISIEDHISYGSVVIGDNDGIFDGAHMELDNYGSRFIFHGNEFIVDASINFEVNTNYGITFIYEENIYLYGTTIYTSTHGGNSGQYLKVNVNGNQYLIVLKNP